MASDQTNKLKENSKLHNFGKTAVNQYLTNQQVVMLGFEATTVAMLVNGVSDVHMCDPDPPQT